MRKLSLVAALTALLVVAPPAAAKIVVGKSIAGVALGVSENDVVATLGQPKSISVISDPDNSARSSRTLNYGDTKVYVAIEPGAPGVVSLIRTRSKNQKTANGVGVGTTEKTLKKRVKGIRCYGKRSDRRCSKGSGNPGTVISGFFLSRGGKVTEIDIGRIAV